MSFIDLRSDTVTQPTKEMREAMFSAVVGDDVYMDDPTVARLEALAAKMLGKPAAIFVSSGTMGNQLAVMSATNRGDEIILGDTYHIFGHEAGGVGLLSGANMHVLPFKNSIPDVKMIENAIRGEDIHFPKTAMICLENALSNGMVVPTNTVSKIYKLARSHKIHLHIDGARLFNAATSLECDVKDITKHCDSVMVCLSKGLCAPMGSIVAGERKFIDSVRRYRKILGGGTRQAGHMAAAGIVALESMTKRLSDDHNNAKYLAQKLSEIDCIEVDKASVQINMVFFKIKKSDTFLKNLPELMLKKNIKINEMAEGLFRFVTSNDVGRDSVDRVLSVLMDILVSAK